MFPVLFYLNYNFSFPLIKVAISETAISVSVKKMSFITCVLLQREGGLPVSEFEGEE